MGDGEGEKWPQREGEREGGGNFVCPSSYTISEVIVSPY